MLKVIRRAGLDKDPVFRTLTKETWKTSLSEATREWVRSRYRRTCPACAKRYWTSPGTLPVCNECWSKLPSEVCSWWWMSKRTQKTLERLLDDYFDGGYETPEDPRQLAGWHGVPEK